MPPLPTIPLPVLRSLAAQLRHAPRETVLRDVERTEELARDIDPAIQYPHDWIVFRVTGFRPDDAPPGSAGGAELLASLSPFAEVLCAGAGLRAAELQAGVFVRAAELSREWGASTATLKRWRRAGLVTRRALGVSGREEVWVSRLCAEHFRGTHARAMERVRKGDRLTEQQRAGVVAEALRLRAQGRSLHSAAAAIAEASGRSVEGVRYQLRADARTAAAFQGARRLRVNTDPVRRRAALLRLWRRGADPAELARLTRKSVPLTRRDINLARAEQLRAWHGAGAFTTPTSSSPVDPGQATEVVRGLPAAPPFGRPTPLAVMLPEWRTRAPLPKQHEHAIARAFHALRAHAASLTEALSRLHPRARALDEAETSLRWASLLRAQLLRSQHRLVVETIEARAGQPLDRTPHVLASRLLQEAVAAAAGAVDHFDPAKGGRLAGPVGLALDKAVVRVMKDAPPGPGQRAASQAGAPVALPRVSVWDRALMPDPRIALAVAAAHGPGADPAIALLADRFGLSGAPPRTLTQLRVARGMTEVAIARAIQRAIIQTVRSHATIPP